MIGDLTTVLFLSALSAVLSELLYFVYIKRNPEAKAVQRSMQQLEEKVRMENPYNLKRAKEDKKHRANKERLSSLKTEKQKLSSSFTVINGGVLFAFSYFLRKFYQGRVIAVLPFPLFSFLKRFGIQDQIDSSVFYISFLPLYVITGQIIRKNIQILVKRERDQEKVEEDLPFFLQQTNSQ